jgi:hypothetical protein
MIQSDSMRELDANYGDIYNEVNGMSLGIEIRSICV